MAKTSSTIYLEEKYWNIIKEYQIENQLSSRNDALTLMINEWLILNKIDFNNININVNGIKEVKCKEKEMIVKDKKDDVDPRISNGLMKIMNSMKSD